MAYIPYRHWKLGDVFVPSVETISGTGQGRGIVLSNYPDQIGNRFGVENLEGNINQGWEVELYIDKVLYGRREATDTGRFLFADIPISYGSTEYRLVFYGPRGERREEIRHISLDNRFFNTRYGELSVFSHQ